MNARRGRRILTGALLAAAAIAAQAGAGEPLRAVPPSSVLIAWDERAAREDSLDQLSLQSVASAMGFSAERITPARAAATKPGSCALLVIPHAAALKLSARERRAVASIVARGVTLLTDGPGDLCGALGFRTGEPAYVQEVTDVARPNLAIRWPDSASVPFIAHAPTPEARVVYREKPLGRPLAIIADIGKGRCLYIAPLVDPGSPDGWGRFPTLPSVLREEAGLIPPLSRRGADAYFDPGFRWATPPESLARLWRSEGIRGLHVAAWYDRSTPPYDYARLLRALHEQGLLAYAWLEWPYIGKGFWDAHPEWRQKNALLQDAHLDFLYLMDLQNPACMDAALEGLRALLRDDWDGVDVAEFTLTGAIVEALAGPTIPQYFTGFTDAGRKEFAARGGFDPVELFDTASAHYWKRDSAGLRAFYRYRTDANVAAQRRLLTELRRGERWARGAGELMLTIIDNTLHPEFDNLLGFSMEETKALVAEFDLTLVVEDPFSEWHRHPSRYAAMGTAYRTLLGDHPFMIDVNVVSMAAQRKGRYATVQATGTEFLSLRANASRETDRVCFYAESSVFAHDWSLLPGAMAAGGTVRNVPGGIEVESPYTVSLRSGTGEVLVDGEAWPAMSDSAIIVPAGKHLIRPAPGGPGRRTLHVTSITGELMGAKREGRAIVVRTRSRGRCAVDLDGKPVSVSVDGIEMQKGIYPSGKGCVILLAGGEHEVRITARR